MALLSPEQLAANRENAQGSTGPTSDAGRRTVARNAIRHGLSGSGLLLPEAEAAKANQREAALRLGLVPQSETESLFIRQMAVYSVKAEQARALQVEVRTRAIERAETFWTDDRRLEMLDIAANLARDPERTVQELTTKREGAAWLRGRWALLRKTIEVAGDWNPTQRALALDLLGLPAEFRDVCPIEIDSDQIETQRQLRLDLAGAEINRLTHLIDHHLTPLDSAERNRAEFGVEPVLNQEIRLLRRYERDAQHRYEWAWSELRKHRNAAKESVSVLTKQSHLAEFDPALTVESDAPASDEGLDPDSLDLDGLSLEESVASEERALLSPQLRGNRRQRKALEAIRRRAEKQAERSQVVQIS